MTKKITLFAVLSFWIFFDVEGQVYSFPQNRDYPYGFQQTVTTQAASSTLAATWYSNWKTSWVESCGGGIYRVKDGGGSSYSEGIGYGMLMAAYAGDKTLFDGFWTYYKNNRNVNGVMDWCQSNCGGTNCGNNGATDGDLDAAMALIIANCQWPSATYVSDATTLITAIKNTEFTTCSGKTIQKPGDVFGGCNCTNPSYFAPGYYRAFAEFVPSQAAFWTTAATDAYTLLDQIDHATTGLVPAWTDSGGGLTGGSGDCASIAASGGGNRWEYQFDAARTPWRIATDYLWWGTPAAQTWLTKVTNWVNGVGISNIVAGYDLDGSPNVSYKNSAFTGAFALGAMANSQAMTNTFYDWWTNNSVTSGTVGTKLDDAPYFQNSLRTIYLFLASGNFWYPCTSTPPCRTPNLGADFSTCGTSFPYTLNSNTPTATNVAFTWKRHSPSPTTLVTANASQTTFQVTSAMGAGTYVVVRDSMTCSKSDTIVITSTLPAPVMSPSGTINLCNPSSINFTVTNAASFPGATTWQWSKGGSAITGATTNVLSNVRQAGTYRITASIGGCTSTFDEEVVTSSLPTPVDGCRSGTGTVNLSITNPGLNGTNYNWYADASTSTPLTGGVGTTTFTTPSISTSTTYYVQDMSAVSDFVGPSTVYGGLQNWGCNAQNLLLFTATTNFTLKSVKVPFININNSGNAVINIQILDASNVVRASFTSDATAYPATPATQLITFTFNSGNGVLIDRTSWGANLKMGMQTPTCENVNGDPAWNQSVSPTYSAGAFISTGSIVTITGSERSGSAANSDYMYFYDWEISTGTTCARLPVVATVDGSCSLPVGLINFYATKNSDHVHLSWATSWEQNNDYFKVERSLDGVNYSLLNKVKGNGSSESIKLYAYLDYESFHGTAYYRIGQYDYDGAFSYSPVVSVTREDNTQLSVVPNPFTNNSEIKVLSNMESPIHITVTDVSGAVKFTSEEYSTNEAILVGEDLPKGLYIIQAVFNDKIYTSKMVKQ